MMMMMMMMNCHLLIKSRCTDKGRDKNTRSYMILNQHIFYKTSTLDSYFRFCPTMRQSVQQKFNHFGKHRPTVG
jgi:hypothetical protein